MKLIFVICCAAIWFDQAYGQTDNVNVEEVSHEPSTQATIESMETTDTTDTTDITSRSTATTNVSDNSIKIQQMHPNYLTKFPCRNVTVARNAYHIICVQMDLL